MLSGLIGVNICLFLTDSFINNSSGEREAVPQESGQLPVSPRPDDGDVCPVPAHQSVHPRGPRTEGENLHHNSWALTWTLHHACWALIWTLHHTTGALTLTLHHTTWALTWTFCHTTGALTWILHHNTRALMWTLHHTSCTSHGNKPFSSLY